MTAERCSCTSDAECKAPNTKCMLPFAKAKYKQCQKPCAKSEDCGIDLTCNTTTGRCVVCQKDDDCTTPGLSRCNTALGTCVECMGNGDCVPDFPFCDPKNNTCVQCLLDTDCPKSSPACNLGSCVECNGPQYCVSDPKGGICQGSFCGCGVDGDCQSSSAYGVKCITAPTGKSCGCASNTHCATNQHGPYCNTSESQCSCYSDAQCKTAPSTKCALASGNTVLYVGFCEKPCTNNSDCASKPGLPTCNTAIFR